MKTALNNDNRFRKMFLNDPISDEIVTASEEEFVLFSSKTNVWSRDAGFRSKENFCKWPDEFIYRTMTVYVENNSISK